MSKHTEHHVVTGVDVLHAADGDDILIGLATGFGSEKSWKYFRVMGQSKATLLTELTRPAWTRTEDDVDDEANEHDGRSEVGGQSPLPGPTL